MYLISNGMPVTVFMMLLQQQHQSTNQTTQFTVHLVEPCTLPARSNPPDICSRVLHTYSHCCTWQLLVATHCIGAVHSPHIHGGVSTVKTKYRPCGPPGSPVLWDTLSPPITKMGSGYCEILNMAASLLDRQSWPRSQPVWVTETEHTKHGDSGAVEVPQRMSGVGKSDNWLWSSPLHNARSQMIINIKFNTAGPPYIHIRTQYVRTHIHITGT